MKFYITVENIAKLKRSFLNLKLYSIIDIPSILEEYGYRYDNISEYGSFIINEKINSLISTYIKSKRIRGIIYTNENLNRDIINNLFDTLEPLGKIQDIVLLDDYNVPKLKPFYEYFNEVIFFPSIKKVRLIECKPVNELVDWKI